MNAKNGKISTESIAAPTSAAAFCGFIRPVSSPISVIATTSGSAVAESNDHREQLGAGEDAPVQEQHRYSAHQEEQSEEERHAEDGDGVFRERVEVEAHPAHDEEDRDEHTEGDARQLLFDDVRLLSMVREPHDETGDECAEQDVEPELARDPHEERDQQHRDANRELRARVERAPEELDDARRSGPDRHRHRPGGQRDEEHKEQRGLGRVVAREQERDRHDGKELAGASNREDVRTEPGVHDVLVFEHRQERAEGGRGQREADEQRRDRESSEHEPAGDRDRDRERHEPTDTGELERAASNLGELDLVARHEEEEAQTEARERGDGRRLRGQGQYLWTDQDPGQELEHHARNLATGCLRQERCHRRDCGDQRDG